MVGRILDQTNGKPFQRQCRAIANENVCGLLIGRMLAAQISRGNTRSSERQTLTETVSVDSKLINQLKSTNCYELSYVCKVCLVYEDHEY